MRQRFAKLLIWVGPLVIAGACVDFESEEGKMTGGESLSPKVFFAFAGAIALSIGITVATERDEKNEAEENEE